MVVECCMRSHHYGRHGPHAWQKWHKQRYRRPSLLPVPVAPPTVIRVHIPVTAERIIFIIMTGYSQEDEQVTSTDLQTVEATGTLQSTDKVRSIQLGMNGLNPEQAIINEAEANAEKDARHVKRLQLSSFVVIDQDLLDDLLLEQADQAIKKVFPLAPNRQTRQELREIYADTYQRSFATEVAGYNIESQDATKSRFRVQAMSDRARHIGGDIRDLAVLRAAQLRELTLETAIEQLATLHSYVELYQRFYTYPREETRWPTQDSFRS